MKQGVNALGSVHDLSICLHERQSVSALKIAVPNKYGLSLVTRDVCVPVINSRMRIIMRMQSHENFVSQ